MKFVNHAFRYFLTGVITLLPFIVTVALVTWLSGFLASYLGPKTVVGKMLMKLGMGMAPETAGTVSIWAYVWGWLIVLIVIFVVGILMETALKRVWTACIDNQVKKIPIIGQVYSTTRQFTALMKKNEDDAMQNMSPVYCRFGGTLFLALLPVGDEYEVEGRNYRIVLIPTAPVPFGGAVMLVPSEDVLPANISMDALMAFYVSMGASSGDFMTKKEKCENE
ncbi:MAG: DUF502 domain-containing protein [Planctomycetia bacterium]|nr:DUF502 domain-containing protein [Planctomycetia bacterium]